jgi:hypothetical protein
MVGVTGLIRPLRGLTLRANGARRAPLFSAIFDGSVNLLLRFNP